MRTIIIGDIHGCSRALESILELTRPDPASDRLILLGDLFDRGPDSWDVLQKMKKLEGTFGSRFVLLRGNHEDYLLREKLTFMEKLTWERVGRSATARSFRAHRGKMEDAVPWLRDHAVLYWKNACSGTAGTGEPFFQCVHAGIMVDPMEANDRYTMIHDHFIVERNQYAGPLTISGHIALEEPAWFPGEGRTPVVLSYGPARRLPERGVICIDTGCGKGGKLTAMIIEGGVFTLYGVPESV